MTRRKFVVVHWKLEKVNLIETFGSEPFPMIVEKAIAHLPLLLFFAASWDVGRG
jgi:hypothetical protein